MTHSLENRIQARSDLEQIEADSRTLPMQKKLIYEYLKRANPTEIEQARVDSLDQTNAMPVRLAATQFLIDIVEEII